MKAISGPVRLKRQPNSMNSVLLTSRVTDGTTQSTVHVYENVYHNAAKSPKNLKFIHLVYFFLFYRSIILHFLSEIGKSVILMFFRDNFRVCKLKIGQSFAGHKSVT